MRVAAIQINPKLGNLSYNIKRSCFLIEKAVERRAKLIVLPELTSSGYALKSRKEALKFAEKIPGPTTKAWEKLAKKHGVYIAGGINEVENGKLYNSGCVVGPKGYMGKFRKLHLFFNEKKIFELGERVDIFEADDFRFSVLVCYDSCFPEAARVAAFKGAQIICFPSCYVKLPCDYRVKGWGEPMPGFTPHLARVRCMENVVFGIAASRTGSERGIEYPGLSMIIGARGELLAKCDENDKETILIADIEPEIAKDKSVTELDDLFKDARPELYREILRGKNKG